jgi:hypothetical protein
MTKEKLTYVGASWGCILHALLLSITLYCGFTDLSGAPAWLIQFGSTTWLVLLCVWPVWALILWWATNGKIRSIIPPFVTGLLLLCPALFMLYVIYAMTHAKHI